MAGLLRTQMKKKSHEQRSKYREINLNQCKKTDDGQTEVCTFHVTVYISELSLCEGLV